MQNNISDLLKFFLETADTGLGKEKKEENLLNILQLWFRGIAANILSKTPEEKRQQLIDLTKTVEEKSAQEMENLIVQAESLFSLSGFSAKDMERVVVEEGNRIRATLTG